MTGARLAETRPAPRQFADTKIIVAVRSQALRLQVQKAIGERKDIRIVVANEVPQSDLPTLFIDEDDLNRKAKIRLLEYIDRAALERQPLLREILISGREATPEELETVREDLYALLRPLAPKSIEEEVLSPEQALKRIKLEVYHPSFGYTFDKLQVANPKEPRAAVWTLAQVLSDPFFFETLADRDRKLAGRMVLDDFAVVKDRKALREMLGERYDAFMSRFDGRIIESTSPYLSDTYAMLGDYKKEHVLFVDHEEEQTLKPDASLKLLVARGPYALTLDKVVVEILARGASFTPIFIKGLTREGNVFIFSPVVPIDFEKHFKRFYTALRQTAQAA